MSGILQESASEILTIQERPLIEIYPVTATVFNNGQLTMTCRIIGGLMGRISWYENGTLAKQTGEAKHTTARFEK